MEVVYGKGGDFLNFLDFLILDELLLSRKEVHGLENI